MLLIGRKVLQDIFYFLLTCLIIGVTALILGKKGINNLPLLHLFTLLEYFFLSRWYNKLLTPNTLIQKVHHYSIFLFVLIIILNSIYIQPLYTFNTFSKTLTHLLLLMNPILYCIDRLRQDVIVELSTSISFINAAVLLYYSGSLFIFMSSAYFTNEITDYSKIPWVINSILQFIFQFTILVGIWKQNHSFGN